jgi:hypothetical protein
LTDASEKPSEQAAKRKRPFTCQCAAKLGQ